MESFVLVFYKVFNNYSELLSVYKPTLRRVPGLTFEKLLLEHLWLSVVRSCARPLMKYARVFFRIS